MNALSLCQRVQRRNPSYNQSEYLDEVNVGYKECWDYITQLDESYFTDIKTLTVTTSAAEFDFLTNANGNLSSAISLRAFQISRIRILTAGSANWVSAHPRSWNDNDFLAQQVVTPQTASSSGPFLYIPFAKFSLLFAMPLPVGTQIEVVYNFTWVPLTIYTTGTIVSSSTTIIGTGTSFTQVVQPDYVASLPGNDQDTDISLEIVPNVGPANWQNPAGNQAWRIARVVSDTTLTLLVAPVPAIPVLSIYSLCTVPDIPEGHHNVISSIATRNFMSTPGNDARFSTWAALAEKELNAMRDTIMTRQRQEPSRVRPFPQRLTRGA